MCNTTKRENHWNSHTQIYNTHKVQYYGPNLGLLFVKTGRWQCKLKDEGIFVL